MNKRTALRIVLMISVFAVSALAVQATVLRGYVSSTGNDANVGGNCAQSAPCKTFAAAISVVTSGGELIALDSSGYGGIPNINKSITIAAVPGAHAFIVVAAGTNGMVVNGGVNDLVTLRNLHFNGSGSVGSAGVRFNTGTALHIENCTFTGLDKGIYDVAAPALMTVTDSTFRDSDEGIVLEPTDPDFTHHARASIDHCRFENYFHGFVAAGRYSTVTIRNSHFTGRSKDPLVTYGGILASPNSAGTTRIMSENNLVANNYLGIGTTTDGVAFISLSETVIYGNQLGVFACCLSKIITMGNNRFENNNDDGSFNLSSPLK
jgi:hypothetical protein